MRHQSWIAFAALTIGGGASPPASAAPMAEMAFAARPRAPANAQARAAGPSAVADAVAEALQPSSEAALQMSEWVTASQNNGDRPFIVIDKFAAAVFVFDPEGEFLGETPALLGI